MLNYKDQKDVKVRNIIFNNRKKLNLIAGPCIIENEKLIFRLAGELTELRKKVNVNVIFKNSYDKANRSSINSYRGPGIKKGLRILEKIKKKFDLPLLIDVHKSEDVKPAAEIADIIQIPAFLCRQTDLLIAAAKTKKTVNVKKGQFLAPWDVKNIIEKIESVNNKKIMLTERGVCFGYNRWVVDMCAFPEMAKTGYPVIFDTTHSVQTPGGEGHFSGGNTSLEAFALGKPVVTHAGEFMRGRVTSGLVIIGPGKVGLALGYALMQAEAAATRPDSSPRPGIAGPGPRVL